LLHFESSLIGSKIDRNDYYSDNNCLATYSLTSGGKSTSYYKLSDWQKTGYDSNSISIDPQFISSTDLHVRNALLRQAIPINGITTDIDGDPRSSTHPFIGADEFKVYRNDASLAVADSMNYTFCPYSAEPVILKIKNTGSDTLTFATIKWTINGMAQKDSTWKGKLGFYHSAPIVLMDKTDTFAKIKAWIVNPNGTADSTNGDDTVSLSVKHAIPPSADFTFSPDCPGYPCSFTDKSIANSSPITSYYWDFGDGGTSTDKNPNHIYMKSGSYMVTYAVSGQCTDTIRKAVYLPRLIPGFSFTSACLGDTISFADTSITDSVKMYADAWTFGDGGTSKSFNPKHLYAKAGTYRVSLRITSILFCHDTISHLVTVYAKPKAKFGLNNSSVCQGETVSISDSSSGSALKYLWDYGDGTVDSARTPTHTYTSAGTYRVRLLVANAGGCIDSTSRTINILPKPQAHFTSANVCLGDSTFFKDSSATAAGVSASYTWDFGDSTKSTLKNPAHLYKRPDTYKVSETVTVNGCSDIYTHTVTVYTKPTAHFTENINHQHVTFIPADSSLMSYLWSFGDSTTSVGKSPTHTYARSGHYAIQLTTTNKNGCSNTDTASVDILYTGEAYDLTNVYALNVYPNPFDQQTILAFNLVERNTVAVNLYDVLGRKIEIQQAQQMLPGNHAIEIRSAYYAIKPGIYNLEILIGNNAITRSVVKIR
jgi:PKD repeat protein